MRSSLSCRSLIGRHATAIQCWLERDDHSCLRSAPPCTAGLLSPVHPLLWRFCHQTPDATHSLLLVRNVEALLVETQGLASLTRIQAEVLELLLDPPHPPSRVCRHEQLDCALPLLSHRLLRERVDALHHSHLVGHELVEAHVEHLISGNECTIAH